LSGKPTKIWEQEDEGQSADVPTPVASGDTTYLLTDRGRVRCLDMATGEEKWAGDLPRHRNKYYASPVLAGGKLYCAREDGVVFVVDVANGFKLLAENNMDEKIIATPVPIRGGLLIRGAERLFRIGGETAPQAAQAAG
jgi:outer membrane protein assembly factor BamB